MSKPPSNNPPGHAFKISTFSNSHAQFIGTTGSLSSHLIIDKFEERHNIHAPEMTFFQNTLVVNHSTQNVSLVFTCADAILGTIYPKLSPAPSSSPSLNPTSNALAAPASPTSDFLPFGKLHPNHDPTRFIPSQVQVKDSKKWQEYMQKNENKPDVIEEPTEVGDWTCTSLYQGHFYPNTPENSNFFTILPTSSSSIPPTPSTASDPTSPFLEHLTTLVPSQNLLTQASPAQISFSSTPAPSTPATSHSPHPNSNFLHTTPPRRSSDAGEPTQPTTTSIAAELVSDSPTEPVPDPLFAQPLPIPLCPPSLSISTDSDAGQSTLSQPDPFVPVPSLWEANFKGPGIDYGLLTNKNEKIEFYQHIILFEDELHDNGISNYSIRIRVMGSCYYVLIRNFVRVDNVMVRIRDTRYFYKFNQDINPSPTTSLHSLHSSHPSTQQTPAAPSTPVSPSPLTNAPPRPDYLIRETKLQEATFEQLRAMKRSVVPKDYTEEFSSHVLPVNYLITERIDLNCLQTRLE